MSIKRRNKIYYVFLLMISNLKFFNNNIHYVNFRKWLIIRELGKASGVWPSHFGPKPGGHFPLFNQGCTEILV